MSNKITSKNEMDSEIGNRSHSAIYSEVKINRDEAMNNYTCFHVDPLQEYNEYGNISA